MGADGAASAASADGARVTVASALQLPQLRKGLPRVVAGEENLDTPIRWVHAGEVPDLPRLLRGGEMLLTAGMGIGARPSQQRRFIASLTDRGLAALAIEVGPVFERLPRPLVEEARSRGLPLIELRREVLFVTVTEAIHTKIVNQRDAMLRRGEQLHRHFTALALDGSGIPELLRALYQIVGNPVVLENDQGRLLYHVSGTDGDGEAISAWESLKGVGTDAGDLLTLPVALGDSGLARLVVLGLESPIEEVDGIAAERAASVIALMMLRIRQEEELVARDRGELLERLASGAVSASETSRQAARLGFASNASLLLPVAVRVAPPPGYAATDLGHSASWTGLDRRFRELIGARGVVALAGVRPQHDELLLVAEQRSAEERSHSASLLAKDARSAAAAVFGGEASVVVAVGACCGWSRAAASLRAAAASAATPAAGGEAGAQWRDATRPSLEVLLWGLRDDPRLQAFVDASLAPVIDHDRRAKHQLLPTLEALCRCGGRRSEAARALLVNRKTLYGRIARLEGLLEADLSDTPTLTALEVALYAARQRETSTDLTDS